MTIAQINVAIPGGATALPIASFRSNEKLGPVSAHVSASAEIASFTGKPKSIDPLLISWEESNDNGATWSAIAGGEVTVVGEKIMAIIPKYVLFRAKGRTSGGAGGAARIDIQVNGRLFQGTLETKAFFGKQGFTTVDDASPTAAEGSNSAVATAAWPNAQGSDV